MYDGEILSLHRKLVGVLVSIEGIQGHPETRFALVIITAEKVGGSNLATFVSLHISDYGTKAKHACRGPF
jgi:hypothetical protein